MKERYNNMPLLNKSYISEDEFSTLEKHALKYASVFGQRTAVNRCFQNSQLQKVNYVPDLPMQT